MKKIRFGRKQLDNPTPRGVAFNLNIIMAVCTAIATWLNSAPYIPAKYSSIIASVLGGITLICLGIKPFYGVETTEKTVPVKDVSEMEVKP